jgi:hypothetical protein
MKIQHHHQTESLLSLTYEGQETGDRICQILTDMDAIKSVYRLRRVHAWLPEHGSSKEQQLFKQALSSVDYAEDAATELNEVIARRKMSATDEHQQLVVKAQQLGARAYRNLWEISLSDTDRDIVRNLIKKIAVLSVWEDLPATMSGRSYERVVNEMDGTIAYTHAYGVTFMDYKTGKAAAGWTLLREALEESVVCARSDFELAAQRIQA